MFPPTLEDPREAIGEDEMKKKFVESIVASLLLLMLITVGTGCATAKRGHAPTGVTMAYIPTGAEDAVSTNAPVFLVEHDENSYNRIGTPSARYSPRGKEEIFVDPLTPTVYWQVSTFVVSGREYTNYFYRVHFERSPFSLVPFNAATGRNVGAFIVVTTDDEGRPLFINTVQSCGCYHGIVPTDYLRDSVFPQDWNVDEDQNVYGEHLPRLLRIAGKQDGDARLIVTLRADTHRIGDVRYGPLRDVSPDTPVSTAALVPIDALKRLPLGDSTTSFYHTEGRKRGLVKGAWKPWETLLFGVLSCDAHVGQDREYGTREDTGRRFYTTLRAWKKEETDMAYYAGYLAYNGWSL